jgi:tight adherence protein B
MVAFLLGVAIAACLVGIVAAVRGVQFADFDNTAAKIPFRRMALAGAAGAGLLAFTGLPIAVVIGVALGWWVPGMIAAARSRHAAIERTEAIATWTRQVADTMTGSSPVNALRATATTAPPPIAAQVRQLDRDLTRMPLGDAVHAFARGLDDPSADIVVAALNAANRSGGAATKVLVELAQAADLHADMRRRMDSARAGLDTRARIVTGVFITGFLLARILNPSVLAPYHTVVGQLVLAVATAMFALSYVWLARMRRDDQPESVLAQVTAP